MKMWSATYVLDMDRMISVLKVIAIKYQIGYLESRPLKILGFNGEAVSVKLDDVTPFSKDEERSTFNVQRL